MDRANNKVGIYILVISLFSIYTITCKAQDAFVKNSYSFDVGSAIKKTNLKITQGDFVHLTASGKVVLRGVTGTAGPEGMDGFKNCCMDPVFPYGSLLYKIGEDDWNIVDPDDTITAEQTGFLKFMVNDNDPSGNSGKFTVKVVVTSIKTGNTPAVAKKAEPKKVAESATPHLSPGILTLSELQKANNGNLNEARAFLTSKQFKFDDESNEQMNKFSFKKDNVTASIIKDASQTTFTTSSADNYKSIKASLDDYGYKHRDLEKKIDGVTKYANSKYSLFIVLLKLNNKRQYFFAIKKLQPIEKN